jgi:hypothetical protein
MTLGGAPDAIYIPTFTIQLERLFTACMCWALKERMVKRLRQNLGADSTAPRSSRWKEGLSRTKVFQATKAKFTMAFDAEVNWENCEDPRIKANQELLSSPVSCEELHVALMNITPKIFSGRESDDSSNRIGTDPLVAFISRNRGLMEGWCDISWLFEQAGHQDRVGGFIKEPAHSGDGSKSDQLQACASAKPDELPFAEVWEDHTEFDAVDSELVEGSKSSLRLMNHATGPPAVAVEKSLGHWNAVYDLYQLQCQEKDNAYIGQPTEGILPSPPDEYARQEQPSIKVGPTEVMI